MSKKKITIKPLYIKDATGKSTHVSITPKVYDAILKRIEEFDKIKKENRIKKTKTSK